MALTAGDIAIVGLATDSPDTFSFVLLVDIVAGQQIVFTDCAWTGSALATNENTATWTAPAGGVAKGTVIKIVNAVTLDAAYGTVVGALSGLSSSGDQVLAYTGTSANPTFIYAASTKGWLTSGTTSSNTSYLPVGLTDGTTAVGLAEVDNYAYSLSLIHI